ncbi:MAG: hypothetical protein LBU23_10655, partial [Planctomycetota bacterium]|nr:hypothetical protein [Planctomycetota bacterium]
SCCLLFIKKLVEWMRGDSGGSNAFPYIYPSVPLSVKAKISNYFSKKDDISLAIQLCSEYNAFIR